MKNSLRIHKWTHNEFNIFILGVLTHPRCDFTVTATLFGKKPTNGIFKGREGYPFSALFDPAAKC